MNRSKLLAALNIRPGEEMLVSWVLIYAFFMGIPALITETAAYSLFLEQYSAQAIPYIYIGFAVVTTVSGFAYTALEKRISFFRFASINLFILALMPFLFRIILRATPAPWALPALAIWYEVSWALANLGFWSLAVHLFDLRQGKRLFGLIGIGLTLSEALAGFLVPGFVSLVGTANLLLVATVSFLGALLVQTHILRSNTHLAGAKTDDPDQTAAVPRWSLIDLFKNNYIVLIFALAGLYAISFYALDNAFYGQAQLNFLEADQLASFLGVFFGLSSLATLILGAFISGKLISRYGLRFGLLLMPVIILIGVGITATVGTFFKLVAVLFWLVATTKFLNEVLAYTINRAAWQVLYEPLPDNQRLQSQTVVESMVKPVAGGVAGLLLIGFNAAFGFSTVQIAYLLLLALLAWIGVVIWINRLYPAMLLQALAKQRLSETAIEIDRSHVGIFNKGLRSPHVGVVIYSLNMLEEIAPETMPQFLQSLLRHPAPKIRQTALQRIERFGVAEATPVVRHLVEHDSSIKVRGTALRTWVALSNPADLNGAHAYLDSFIFQMRLGAMVGLLRKGALTGQPLTKLAKKLTDWANSPDSNERILAAQVVGEVNLAPFNCLLLKLLDDGSMEVREAALSAAKKLRDPEIWAAVIQNLNAPKMRLRSLATAALVSGGKDVIHHLHAALANNRHNKELFVQLIRVCGQIRTPQAGTVLIDYLDFPDVRVRTQIFTALSRCHYQATKAERPAIEQQLKTEAAHATWVLAAIANFQENDSLALVETALKNDLAGYRLRLLLLLSFIYPRQTILPAWDNLRAYNASLAKLWDKKKAYALEVIDVTISSDLKSMVLPLLDNLTPRQRLAQLEPVFPQEKLTQLQYLTEIITTADAWFSTWTKATALYVVAKPEFKALTPVVITVAGAANGTNELVRHTAFMALQQLKPAMYAQITESGYNNNNKYAKYLAIQPHKEKKMLSLIERVILLKSVGIFSETPEEVLAEVAVVLEEVEAKAGESIIKQGNLGDSLYIIIDGVVKVHHDSHLITTLGESEMFGEFSLLDPGPRAATVTALENTRLFRLDQKIFLELLDEHSTIARKIIQVLVRYLRRTNFQFDYLTYQNDTANSSG